MDTLSSFHIYMLMYDFVKSTFQILGVLPACPATPKGEDMAVGLIILQLIVQEHLIDKTNNRTRFAHTRSGFTAKVNFFWFLVAIS